MELDEHQVVEFGQHWSGTYMRHNDDLVYVTESYDVRGKTIGTIRYPKADLSPKKMDGRKAIVSIYELEPISLPKKYIQGSVQHAYHFSRYPRQNSRRGVNSRNCALNAITDVRPTNGEAVTSPVSILPQHIASVFYNTPIFPMDKKSICGILLDINSNAESVVLNDSLALVRRSTDYCPMLLCNNTLVGFFDGETLNLSPKKIQFKELCETQNMFDVRIAA